MYLYTLKTYFLKLSCVFCILAACVGFGTFLFWHNWYVGSLNGHGKLTCFQGNGVAGHALSSRGGRAGTDFIDGAAGQVGHLTGSAIWVTDMHVAHSANHSDSVVGSCVSRSPVNQHTRQVTLAHTDDLRHAWSFLGKKEKVCVYYTSLAHIHDLNSNWVCEYTCFVRLWTAGEVTAAYVVAWYDDYAVPAVASEVREGAPGRRVVTQNCFCGIHSTSLIQIRTTHRGPLYHQRLPRHCRNHCELWTARHCGQ